MVGKRASLNERLARRSILNEETGCIEWQGGLNQWIH